MDKIYGIDLGTTNSCISVIRDGKPYIIPVDGNGIVPSIVSFDKNKTMVGRKALNRYAAYPEASVKSVKRLMGGSEKISIGKKKLAPEDISAEILKYLRDEAERIEGNKVERVVITVPAYFSDAQRGATMEAGERAGLIVERIINEPTAAALFYDQIKTDGAGWKYALVYDLGGGTFDVSILKMGEIIEVLSSTGDTKLGGDDFDERIVDIMIQRIKESNQCGFDRSLPALARLRGIAESAKIALTEKASVKIQELGIPISEKDGNASLSMELSREEFERMTEDLVDRTIESVEKALDEAHLNAEDIDRVLLVGGMTRMPVIEERMSSMFGKAQFPVVEPDVCVSKGAAVQGAVISGENCEQILIDVTPHTLSVETLSLVEFDRELICAPIIPRNSQIPVTRSRTFYSLTENQTMVKVNIFQGEGKYPYENNLIGVKRLNLAKAPRHCPIIIEFSYDLNGMVRVVAEQKGYSRKTELLIDSRNPQKFETQSLDDNDTIEDPHSDKAVSNFVTHRAKKALEKTNGKEREELALILKKYEKALANDDDDIDDIEDELLELLDKVSK